MQLLFINVDYLNNYLVNMDSPLRIYTTMHELYDKS